MHICDDNAELDLASAEGNFIEMHRIVMAVGGREGFSEEEGMAASVLNSPDLKRASKLIVCVIYAFSNRWIGIRFVFAAILRCAECRCTRGQLYTYTQS